MTTVQERFEELIERLRQRHYRLTPQRVALVRLLAESEEHPSAARLYEQLREQFPTTSLATVYKTLNVLKEIGEVLEFGFSDEDNRYNRRKPAPHPHLVCIRCHRIVDVEGEMDQQLEQEVAERSGYRIVGHRLDFYGICPDCQQATA